MQRHRRFVAHIDILGMRAMVRRDAEQAWKVLSGLANVRDHIGSLEIARISAGSRELLAQRVFSVMFSDTIVLFTKTEEDDDLQAILVACAELLHKAMCAFVPVRIGLAEGQFFFNLESSMYAGPALIEAYEIGEAAQWLGIATTESICRQAKAANFGSGTDDIVIPAQIPTKQGTVPGYAMNWVAVFRHDFKVPHPIPVELFYSQFAHAFGPFTDLGPTERQKYINTTDFINLHLARA
jgi:hypothetical protein